MIIDKLLNELYGIYDMIHGLVNVPLEDHPNIGEYWGYHFQQILESDVQTPQKWDICQTLVVE